MKNCALLFLIVSLLLGLTVTADAQLPPQSTGPFLVTNFDGDNITVYDSLGNYTHSFTAPGLNGPRGIVFAPNDRIYVASQLTDEVFIFNRDESFITKFTDAQLGGPTGMAVSSSGLLYVCSFNNDQVVVFDLDGTILRMFTGGGLDGPNCVALDGAGNFYVSSSLTSRVMKFDAGENFVASFTGGGLSSPMGIARDADEVLYVAGGGSHNLVKFDTAGVYLGTITHPDLTGPQGVAFDDRGHLFSSSFYQNQVVQFDAGGNYVQTITTGNLQIPRSIAFEPIAVATSVKEHPFESDFKLYQNYPNPFNPITKIQFSIPRSSIVTLKVFDVLGKEITTLLVDEQHPPGIHTSWWRADGVASGVYFYSLVADANPSKDAGDGPSHSRELGQRFVETRKLLLLK